MTCFLPRPMRDDPVCLLAKAGGDGAGDAIC
jgi:hypothetical protein